MNDDIYLLLRILKIMLGAPGPNGVLGRVITLVLSLITLQTLVKNFNLIKTMKFKKQTNDTKKILLKKE